MALQILSPLHRAVRQITLRMETDIEQLGIGLSAEEAHAVCYIAAYGPCPTGNVQRVLGAKRSTITSMLQRLVDRGVLSREADPDDKRVLLVAVTKAGRSKAEQAVAYANELEQRIADQCSQRDLAALQRCLTAIDTVTGVTVVTHAQQPDQT